MKDLIMSRPVIDKMNMNKLMTLCVFCFSLNVMAGEKVDKSIKAQAKGFVEIHNVRGEIDIVGWAKSEIKVTGTLDDMTEKFIFTSSDGHTSIKVKLPRNSHNRSRGGSDLKIMVPEGSKVNFSGVATDLSAKNIVGGIDVNSVSGDIDVSNSAGRTYINSVSGELKLEALQGTLEVSTVSGDLDAQVDCKTLSVSAVSAEVRLNLKQIKSARLSTVSGDINIAGELINDGELKMSSVSGDAFFHVRGELNAQISMETAPGGNITNQYSDDKAKSSFINSHNLRFTAGNGDGVIRMSTVSGNIGLKKD